MAENLDNLLSDPSVADAVNKADSVASAEAELEQHNSEKTPRKRSRAFTEYGNRRYALEEKGLNARSSLISTVNDLNPSQRVNFWLFSRTKPEWSKEITRLISRAVGLEEGFEIVEHMSSKSREYLLVKGKGGYQIIGATGGSVKRLPIDATDPASVNHALRELSSGETLGVTQRLGNLVNKALFGIVLLSMVFQVTSAYKELSSKRFARRKIARLPYIILRNATDELRFWVFDFFRVTGDPAVAAMGYALAQDIGYYFELYLDRLSYNQRVALSQKLKRAIYPTTPSQRNTREQATHPTTLQLPTKLPKLTRQDIERLIYMDRLRLLELKGRLEQSFGALRRDEARLIMRGHDDASARSISAARKDAARLRHLIDSAQKRIEAYRSAQQEPHRLPGATQSYPPIIERPGAPAVDLQVEADLRRQLKESSGRREELLERLSNAKHWEQTYLKALRQQLAESEENIRSLRQWIEILSKLREKDTKELEKIVASRPKSQEKLGQGLYAIWTDFRSALRQGVDVWALARRHDIDFSRPPEEQLVGATRWEIDELWDGGILVHDDLYGSIQALEGGPTSGQLILREPAETETNRDAWNVPGFILKPFLPIFNPNLPIDTGGRE